MANINIYNNLLDMMVIIAKSEYFYSDFCKK